MDVELLSKMVGELIVGHDQVGLPGVGTFVAEVVPATFSDKGYTVNPPYRRLSFHSSRLEDRLLIDFYAESNGVDRDAAKAYLTQFLSDLKAVLKDRKTIIFPGLGRLRATRENNFFFVPDEDLDIFPDGFGLRPVSLKTHSSSLSDDCSVDNLQVVQPVEIAIAEDLENEEIVEAVETEEAVEIAVEEEQVRGKSERKGHRGRWAFVSIAVLLSLLVIALLAFLVLAEVAPDFIDSILYTPEELRIINY